MPYSGSPSGPPIPGAPGSNLPGGAPVYGGPLPVEPQAHKHPLGAIVLIYMLIVVNFQSWLDPFVIIRG